MIQFPKHLIIYDEQEIHYIEGDIHEFKIDNVVDSYIAPDGMPRTIPISREFTFISNNAFDKDTIKLDDTMMKRIAKYNKEKELQKIEEQIKKKEEEIKKLDDILQDREKRVEKLKKFIEEIYDIDINDEYEYDD